MHLFKIDIPWRMSDMKNKYNNILIIRTREQWGKSFFFENICLQLPVLNEFEKTEIKKIAE